MPYTMQEKEEPAQPAPLPTADLKASVAKAMLAATKDKGNQPDPRDEEEWSFPFKFKDSRGVTHEGSFRNKILSIAEQQEAAILQARMQGGLPADAIPASISSINYPISWMEYSLITRPKWAEDLRQIKDRVLILKLWEEVSGHEATFWRLGED